MSLPIKRSKKDIIVVPKLDASEKKKTYALLDTRRVMNKAREISEYINDVAIFSSHSPSVFTNGVVKFPVKINLDKNIFMDEYSEKIHRKFSKVEEEIKNSDMYVLAWKYEPNERKYNLDLINQLKDKVYVYYHPNGDGFFVYTEFRILNPYYNRDITDPETNERLSREEIAAMGLDKPFISINLGTNAGYRKQDIRKAVERIFTKKANILLSLARTGDSIVFDKNMDKKIISGKELNKLIKKGKYLTITDIAYWYIQRVLSSKVKLPKGGSGGLYYVKDLSELRVG